MTAAVEVTTEAGVTSNLDQLVQQGVDGVTGLMRVPEKRGTNLVVPGQHGELHIPGKRYGAAAVVLPMWVRGVTPDGRVPGLSDESARLAFHANLRALVSLFTLDEQVTLTHRLTDGTKRVISGEVIATVEPEVRGSGRNTLGQFTVALNCPHPFWTEPDDTSATLTSHATVPTTLAGLVGADAPMEDLQVVIGPSTNPRFEQAATGIWMQYGGVVGAGQTLTIDTSNDPQTGFSAVGSGGLVVDYRQLTYGQPGVRTTNRWFALKPEPAGPKVLFTHTGGPAATATLTTRRKFKIA